MTTPRPFNFNWILPGELAGMGWPGHVAPFADSLDTATAVQSVRNLGIAAVVSLTERAPDFASTGDHGLQLLHVPIIDMTPPTMAQVEEVCAFTDRILRPTEGAPPGGVAYHCLAGIGRTGTLLCCYLVHLGQGAHDSLTQVRRISRLYVQTRAQELSIAEWERVCRRRR